ncbi:MAG: 4-vinyl reductase [Anaerolineae bacterium]|nr:4-vinyl reductase [Anaerolineae bacterium]
MNSSQRQATRVQDSATLYWPSNMSHILLLALQDVLDARALDAVLDRAELPRHAEDLPLANPGARLSYRDISHVLQALEDVHGACEGKRLAIQVGRAGFRRGIGEFAALFGLADLDCRLLPLHIKLGAALDAMVNVLGDIAGHQVRVEGKVDCFLCTVEHCPACWSRRADAPCCHAVTGLLEGLVAWIGGEDRYRVQETACIAAGAASCRFVIALRPPGETVATGPGIRP